MTSPDQLTPIRGLINIDYTAILLTWAPARGRLDPNMGSRHEVPQMRSIIERRASHEEQQAVSRES